MENNSLGKWGPHNLLGGDNWFYFLIGETKKRKREEWGERLSDYVGAKPNMDTSEDYTSTLDRLSLLRAEHWELRVHAGLHVNHSI